MKHGRKLSLAKKRAIMGLVFISPWLIGFIAFYLKSLIFAVKFSLSEVNIGEFGGFTTEFIGLENFRYALFSHATFNETLVDSIKDIIIDVPLIIFFSLFVSILLNQNFKGRTVFRIIFFIPIILNSGALSSSLELARQAVVGGLSAATSEVAQAVSGQARMDLIIEMFMDFGLPRGLFDYILDAVNRIYEIVQRSGVQIIIFIAALQSVPSSLYEVSQIEGATAYETFWKITFPMVMPLIITNTVYTIVDSFVNSAIVDTAYKEAFTNKNYGLSSSMSLLSTLVVCGILGIIVYQISKRTFYYN